MFSVEGTERFSNCFSLFQVLSRWYLVDIDIVIALELWIEKFKFGRYGPE